MSDKIKRLPNAARLLLKLICMVMIIVPGVLYLLFSAGGFILAIAAGVCGLGASLSVLAVVVMIVSGGFAVKYILIAIGCALFMIVLTVTLTVGQAVIKMGLKKLVDVLMEVIFA